MQAYWTVLLGFLDGLLFGSVGALVSRWMRHRSVPIDRDIWFSDGSHIHVHTVHHPLNEPQAILFLACLFAAISFAAKPFWTSDRLDRRFWTILGVVGVVVWNLWVFVMERWVKTYSSFQEGSLAEAIADLLYGNLSIALRGLPSLVIVLIVNLFYSSAIHFLWRGRD